MTFREEFSNARVAEVPVLDLDCFHSSFEI